VAPPLIGLAAAFLVALGIAAFLFVRNRVLSRRLHDAVTGEESVRDEERLFRSLVQHSSDLILLLDNTGRIQYASPAARHSLGRDADDLVGAKVSELVHPEDRLKVRGVFAECLEDPTATPSIDFRIQRGGGVHWAHVEAVGANHLGDPDVAGITMTLRDITRRKWAEEALRETERKYRTLVEQLPLVTYLDNLDESSSALYMSPQIVPLLGYATEEWLADPELFVKLLHPADRERVLAEVAVSHKRGGPFLSEYRLVARDGRVVWFHDESVTIDGDDGRPLYAQGFMLDITEKKAGESGDGSLAPHVRGVDQLR
jgi:PAS domain S-box-containing protein